MSGSGSVHERGGSMVTSSGGRRFLRGMLGVRPWLASAVVAVGLLLPAAASAAGLSAYVTNFDATGPDGVSQYSLVAGGAITPLTTPTVTSGSKPAVVAVSPNGQFVYVANFTG